MCDEMVNKDIHVVIETNDGVISSVISDGDVVNVAIVERNSIDESSSNYCEDFMGAPGMLAGSFIADSTDIDLHELWTSQLSTDDDE